MPATIIGNRQELTCADRSPTLVNGFVVPGKAEHASMTGHPGMSDGLTAGKRDRQLAKNNLRWAEQQRARLLWDRAPPSDRLGAVRWSSISFNRTHLLALNRSEQDASA
jgi:hypothetical protein